MQSNPTPSAGLESGIGFRLGRAHRRLRSAWESQIADLGLTSAQGAVVRAVAECPGSGLRELARRLHADPMNVKRMADCLEQAGLVHSTSDPADRRRRVLEPTPRGAAVGAQLADRARAWSAQLEQVLGPTDLQLLQSLLDRLEAGLAGYPPTESTRGRRKPEPPSGGVVAEGHLAPARPGENHD
ncbi:MAG: MarR family winged helix-turn-helix transcriptional regulator [Candidatus Limnocylindrales bacterium]